jgi:paraquat-inducible protein A
MPLSRNSYGFLCYLRVLVPLVCYSLAFWFAAEVIVGSATEAAANRRAAAATTAEAKSSYARQWVLEKMTFGYFEGASLADADYEQAVAIANEAHSRTMRFGWCLVGLTIAFMAFASLTARRSGGYGGWRYVVRHATATSLILFVVGVTATAVSLIAYSNVPVLGRVIFKYESKGIAEAISRLFNSGNVVLGGLIMLFSIVIPLIKAALLLMASTTSRNWHDAAIRGIQHFGKWSMADVFVVAVLLAIFAVGSDATTDAHAGPGLFFFAGYCLLSMAAAAALGKSSQRPPVPAFLEWRLWQTADGDRRQEAAVVAVDGDVVRVITRQGRRGRIELVSLSDADRVYVEEWQKVATEPVFEADD